MDTLALRKIARENHVREGRDESLFDLVAATTHSFLSSGGSLDVYSPDCKIDIFAEALTNDCESGDEARFFCQAVEFTLREKYNVDPNWASRIGKFIIQRSIQAHEARAALAEKQSKSSGCLIVVGFIGTLPLGFLVARLLFT